MAYIQPTPSYEYSDVFIVPNHSTVTSRKQVNTEVLLESPNSDLSLSIAVPVISANMDTVTGPKMAIALWEAGAIGALHRFNSISEAVEEFLEVQRAQANCFVSLGVNSNWQERASALYEAGARFFIVDIAHGHSSMMENTVKWLRSRFGRDIFIVAGNIGTSWAVDSMKDWKVDAVKVGIGGGKVCLTKNVTGVVTPMFSTVLECSQRASKWGIPVIADGGAREYGDVAKAIGAGATAVMSGYFFAGCPESPCVGGTTEKGEVIYRGMASSEAAVKVRSVDTLPTPEGESIFVSKKPSAKEVVELLKGGLQSAYSYVGATSTHEFRENITFGIRGR